MGRSLEPEVEISVTRYVRFFVLVLVWVYFETTYENLRLLARDLMDFLHDRYVIIEKGRVWMDGSERALARRSI